MARALVKHPKIDSRRPRTVASTRCVYLGRATVLIAHHTLTYIVCLRKTMYLLHFTGLVRKNMPPFACSINARRAVPSARPLAPFWRYGSAVSLFRRVYMRQSMLLPAFLYFYACALICWRNGWNAALIVF